MLTINWKQVYEVDNKWILILYDISKNHYVGLPIYNKEQKNSILIKSINKYIILNEITDYNRTNIKRCIYIKGKPLKINNNEFLEYATYNNNYYGTLKSKIDEKLENNIDVISEIEVKGARNIKNKYPDSLLIYILPPSLKELENRLRNRKTEDEQTIKNRLNIAKEELKQINIYDYAVVNDNLEETITKVKNIIESEKSRVIRNKIDWSN